MNNNRYKIYPEFHFGIAKLTPGPKTIAELYEMAKLFREDKDFSKVHYQLNDLRQCTFNFEIGQIEKIKSLIDLYKSIDNQMLGVYLIDSPTETAYVHMLFESMEFERVYCSTPERAYILFNLPISFNEFSKLIDI